MLFPVSLTMLPSSFAEFQNALSTRQSIAYATIGALLVSIALHYAHKVNRIDDGAPSLTGCSSYLWTCIDISKGH
jgi:hypothetical protein